MSNKKLPPGVHINPVGKPRPAVKLVPKKQPQIHIQGMTRTYEDVPGFGYDVTQITVDGHLLEIYRACSFASNGGIQVMIIPMAGGAMFTSMAEADAYKEKIKAQALTPQLVTPGHPDFKKPRLLD